MTKTFSFQQIAVPKVLSEEVREAISNNVLQFYVRDQQQEAQDEGITALYERLSQEDKLEGESNSIANQKKILERYCRERGITAYRHYDEDDGYSGTNFNRPGFQRMLADIKAGKIKRVIVKDMSRFGRDYLQVGFYTDMLFPDFGVHFIAVNDGVDSTRGENEFTAIRNVFNEMYARDTSKKIRATWQSKGKSGEHLTTIPPYGYMKDPDNKKKWIIDEEAAAVVQQIFALCVSGMGPTQIAKWLEKAKSSIRTALLAVKGYGKSATSRSRGQTRTSGRMKRFPVCLRTHRVFRAYRKLQNPQAILQEQKEVVERPVRMGDL
ncbi:recombinase family protein [[Ruminococcus] torques]|uniref:recombinase family protein n=1 Tax=[Ruminococcus] torques TaxID=33039 RepID=UPI00399C23D7